MRRKSLIVLISALAFSASLVFFLRGVTGATPTLTPTTNRPAFTMVYEEWGYGFGLNGAPGAQRVKVTYDNPRHWRVEILSHSAVPEVAGSWSTYNGAEIRSFDPRGGEEIVNDVAQDEGVYIPEQWLIPHYISKLLRQSNVTPTDPPSQGLEALIVTEEGPCNQPPNVMRRAGLAPCAEGDRRVAQRKVVYREEGLIPLQIIDTLDGVAIHKISVKELTVR